MPRPSIRIVCCSALAQPGRLELRQALSPERLREDHLAKVQAFLARPDRFAPRARLRGAPENALSRNADRALCFAETERAVFFRKRLRPE